ncbi:hypothetical protein QBC47DRAFT_356792 [Echria macrotheca]|uniref:Uncharacterized protein n=1 Tax=Echria macrotheca TaxID=438768 RepID=A0AAJ0FEL2_9PEZI|nr:hypothetical protein QBC47DRAFT_356792 [Echria macrotheca]
MGPVGPGFQDIEGDHQAARPAILWVGMGLPTMPDEYSTRRWTSTVFPVEGRLFNEESWLYDAILVGACFAPMGPMQLGLVMVHLDHQLAEHTVLYIRVMLSPMCYVKLKIVQVQIQTIVLWLAERFVFLFNFLIGHGAIMVVSFLRDTTLLVGLSVVSLLIVWNIELVLSGIHVG